MHRKGLIKSFSKMFNKLSLGGKDSNFACYSTVSIFQSIMFKKFYNSFKMQSKWNIFPVGSHFSSLWTPKKLCFSFFFIYSYVLSYIHNFLYINLLHALSASFDTTDHSYLLRPLSSPGLPQKYSLLFFLVLKWEILSLPD